ncbi:OLC1v1015474C1 [Oldenlandia corymbosa var. corymbosa]|uniref:OLC1v1015474C1 n=1 Tax=Oldenlandia corymbosa var. corymbosa TaxID=529605 RepID=A0AAV1E3D8_OLDCO|nr:OLC1v1015474C1 [Oldenlandia corymbosa var. corymbosa]
MNVTTSSGSSARFEANDDEEDGSMTVTTSYGSSARFGAANSDDEGSMTVTTPSGSSASMEDGETFDGETSPGQWFGGWKMVGMKEIFFEADYLVCESVYSTNCELKFSENLLEAKGLVANSDQDDFCIRFRLDNIVRIESTWVGRTSKVRIYAPSENEEDETDIRFTGTIKLEFAVMDPQWHEKCEAIRSLDVRYNAIWKVANEMEEYEDNLSQQALPFQNSYFPDFRHFEDFIYPQGDADAVSISKRDVDLLQPDTFVNDTIIDFYIKYLKDKMQPEKRQRFHFFNSFFFRKLADLEKYPPGSFDGRAAFLRVRKWTRKVNLFEKDFIFIPVNHNYHWSLLVICHPGDVASFRDENAIDLARVPCILHMDSIRGTHGDLKTRIQSYLYEEWKERQKESSEDISLKFSNLRFISLELPQQQNSYDCGLFLLHYVEQFLEEDPISVSPFKITPLMRFLTADWFPPSEPSLKRREIQKLIYDLLENHCEETSPTPSDDNYHPLNHSETANAMEFPSEGLSKRCDVNLLPSRADNGLGMNLFPAPLVGSPCANDTGINSVELFDSNATGCSVNIQYQAFHRMPSFNGFKSTLASIEEGAGSIENIAPETRDFSCSSRDMRTEASWNQGSSIHQTACQDDGIASLTVESVFFTDNSLEVQQDGECQVGGGITLHEKMDLTSHTPAGNVQCLTDNFAPVANPMLNVADPHGSKLTIHQDDNLNQDDTADALDACRMGIPDLLKRGIECVAGAAYNNADPALELEELEVKHAAKRPRFVPSAEEHALTQPEDLCP